MQKVTMKASWRNAPQIAMVGCGAIAELRYLPAIARNPSILKNLVLVDINTQRLRALASRFNVNNYVNDYREILNKVDGAIIALPHHLHYPISMDFLMQGVHVLCEKPLAESSVEVKEMVAQAEHSGVTISANNVRRLFPAYAQIKEIISNGKIGNVLSIKYIDGEIFQWPTASGFYFKKSSPKGVLLDRGAHGLDIICWWLGGKPKVISSENDSFGGIEGTALIKCEHNSCSVEVKLSWLSKLQNTYAVVGEDGRIENSIYEWDSITISDKANKGKKIKLKSSEKVSDDFWMKLVGNFIDVVSKGADPLIPASEVIPSIELIEECYKTATTFSMPWYESIKLISGEDGGL